MSVAARASRGRKEAEGSWKAAQAGHRAPQTWLKECPRTRVSSQGRAGSDAGLSSPLGEGAALALQSHPVPPAL